MGTGGKHSRPHCPWGSLISTRDVAPRIRQYGDLCKKDTRQPCLVNVARAERDGWSRRDQEIWHKSQQESIIWAKNRFIKGMDFKAQQKTFEAHWHPMESI